MESPKRQNRGEEDMERLEPESAEFLRQLTRTRRFTLGVPQRFTVSADGERVLFLRTGGGDDPVGRLWVLETGQERPLVTPETTDGGVVSYAADAQARLVAYAVGGELWTVRTDGPSEPVRLGVPGTVVDPRPSPDGRWIAFVSEGAVRVISPEGGEVRTLLAPETEDVTYGLPEPVAAESMGRSRGYWWAPDGSALLVARADVGPVQRWYLSDPVDPAAPAREFRYPVAGTANADVSLHLVRVADGGRREVVWDRQAFEYLTAAEWDAHGPLISVQSRDQRLVRVLAVDAETGLSTLLHEQRDQDWVELVPGTPRRTASGALVGTWDDAVSDTRRLTVAGDAVTPPGLQVRAVVAVDGETVLFAASEEPTETHVWRWERKAAKPEPSDVSRLSIESGVYTACGAGGTVVVSGRGESRDVCTVLRDGKPVGRIASLAEQPLVEPKPTHLRLGARGLRSHLFLPSWYHRPDASTSLPVLLDPYGGQQVQKVTRGLGWHSCASQWFAEQGFAVLVTDGRGGPGRGPAWEKAIRGDVLSLALQDQVDALHAAAERHPALLDLSRVAIRGWSFGGYLAAGAVLRRPDVFHAAVAGAPPADQRLYETHWKERYLGHPAEEPENYDRCSLLADAPGLRRPLLLIHGLLDDNVVVASTLRLSSALLAAGRPHQVLPLPGTTHSVSRGTVLENLLRVQLDFLRRSLNTPEHAA
jgi:dipeptidyl-peptidase-4